MQKISNPLNVIISSLIIRAVLALPFLPRVLSLPPAEYQFNREKLPVFLYAKTLLSFFILNPPEPAAIRRAPFYAMVVPELHAELA
jgi:hypothetical protein